MAKTENKTENSIKPGVKNPVKNPPRSPRSGAILRPFTSVTAKQAAEASARSRQLRAKVRAEMLETLVKNMDFGQEMLKAIKQADAEKIDIIIKALKTIGLDYASSEDAARSGISVKASTGESPEKKADQSLNVSIEVVDGSQA
jgi:hypothetical protein